MGYLRKRSRKRRGGDEKTVADILNQDKGKKTLGSVLNDPNRSKIGEGQGYWSVKNPEEYDTGRAAVTERPSIDLSRDYDSDDDDTDDVLPRRGGRRKSRKNKKSRGKRRFGGRRKTRRYRKSRK